jgi:hypothetical protein
VTINAIIADAAGIVGILSALISVHLGRVRRERTRADKWEAVAGQLTAANENLKDQVRDLRTVALVNERLNARLPKGQSNGC